MWSSRQVSSFRSAAQCGRCSAYGRQRGARVAGTDQRRRRPARTAFMSHGINERRGMGCAPRSGRDLRPRRQDAVADVSSDQGRNGGGPRGRFENVRRQNGRQFSRQRAGRTDDGIDVVVPCGCTHVHIRFAVQRPQRCRERGGTSVQCPPPFIARWLSCATPHHGDRGIHRLHLQRASPSAFICACAMRPT